MTEYVPGTTQPGGNIPQSVTNAVRLMYAGAALGAVSVLYGLVAMGDIREQAAAAAREQAPDLTDEQLDAAIGMGTNIAIGSVIVGGLVGVGLWVWMAIMNQKGRNWARITGTVFFGIATVGTLFSLTGGAGAPANPISTGLGIVTWLVGLGAVIFMYRPESAPHYQPQQIQPPPYPQPPYPPSGPQQPGPYQQGPPPPLG